MDEHVDATRAVPSATGPMPGSAAVGHRGTWAAVAPAAADGSREASRSDATARRAVPGPGLGVPARPTPATVAVARASNPQDEPAGDGTGDHAVDEALTRLAALEGAPLREHVAVFDGVHTALQDRLADTEG